MTTVLVVDDNPEIREILRETLELDYRVVTAGNGEEAIEILTTEVVDLCILDVQMPVTDGFETLRIIRDAENGWPALKVIMLTVRKEPEYWLRSAVIGADIYVTKPFSPTQMLELVHKCLAGEPLTPVEDSSPSG